MNNKKLSKDKDQVKIKQSKNKKPRLMRKNKVRRNENARKIVDVIINKKEEKKIKIENPKDFNVYDESNPLALPSKKRETRILIERKAKPLLSKKKKKLMEKVLERKKKKESLSSILEQLYEVQGNVEEVKHLTSITHSQTMGRKKFLSQQFRPDINGNEKVDISGGSNSFKGMNKRRHYDSDDNNPKKRRRTRERNDIVETSSSDEDESLTENKSSISEEPNSPSHISPLTNQLVSSPDKKQIIIIDSSPTKLPGRGEINSSVDNFPVESTLICETGTVEKIKKNYKVLNRLPDIKEYRTTLPVVSMEFEIMNEISSHSIIIVDGSTGSGKTTQVPQFLYEAGYTNDKMIAVTEPRRIAAIEISKRVAHEMNLTQDVVSYQVRYDGNTTAETKIKFQTDGVLLKEFLRDPLLNQYSVVIVDEAHERSVYSDIMIGILTRVVKARLKRNSPLKVIIMSATMDTISFQNKKLFAEELPIVKVEAKMFTVVVHFNRITPSDYVAEAYKKVCKIHRQLPPGGILIFVTGRDEVLKLTGKLKKTFPKLKNQSNKLSAYEIKLNEVKQKRTMETEEVSVPKINLSQFSEENLLKQKIINNDIESSGVLEDDDENCEDKMNKVFHLEDEQPLHVLPMWSKLTSERLKMVFQEPPSGTRLCVIATNIAETSLTIPNIVYVVDTGKIKRKIYNSITGVSKMEVTWSSKASVDQRKGRAGRVQNGHCYRLYSAMVYEEFSSHAPPDILRRPIDDVVLAMKARKIPVLSFPYITPPPKEELQRGLKRLKLLGALVSNVEKEGLDFSKITPFGEKMVKLPISPRFSKMILESCVYPQLAPYFILLICGLTVQELILDTKLLINSNDSFTIIGSGISRCLGDIIIMLNGLILTEESPDPKEFCERCGIRYKAFLEVRKLRQQLTNEINTIFPELNLPIKPAKSVLSNAEVNLMRKIILQGSLDQIAKKIQNYEVTDKNLKKIYAKSYRILSTDEPVYLHPTCPLINELPNWIVFQDIYETNGRKLLRGVSTIEPQWVVQFAPEMQIFSKPLQIRS